MASKHVFDEEKALEAILYVSKRCPDMYDTLKVLFYADKRHLERYGRLITGDWYVKMDLGPVASNAYDMVKTARGDSNQRSHKRVPLSLAMQGNNLRPLREPEMDLLSISERECLDDAIKEVKSLSMSELIRRTHAEPAYQAAQLNGCISLEVLVRSLPDGDTIWNYMADC